MIQFSAAKEPLALGERRVDPDPIKPYVPPTAAERTAEAFTAKAAVPARQRLETVLAEAGREYTRPLLLFGKKDDPACVELFRSFYDQPDEEQPKTEAVAAAKKLPSPAELRWEFELLSLDTELSEVRELARQLNVEIAKGEPVLAVLHSDGTLAATHACNSAAGKKLDPHSVSRFLVEYKLATRNAEQTLAAAIQRARAENKRVFFIFSASWCGPCRMLARFLDPHKAELEKHYVFVKTDISRDEGIEVLRASSIKRGSRRACHGSRFWTPRGRRRSIRTPRRLILSLARPTWVFRRSRTRSIIS